DLWSRPDRLRRFAPWLTPEQIDLLTRKDGAELTVSDIPILDEAMELLGPDPHQADRDQAEKARREEERRFASDTLAQNGIGTGIVTSQMLLDSINGQDDNQAATQAAGDREWVYGHIVVDEAQELTAMDWRMLVRRCPSRSFTIVGDVAQTAALGGTRSWASTMDKLFGPDGWDLRQLTIDYRNPRQVSNLASSFAASEGLEVSTLKAVREVEGSVSHLRAEDQASLLDQLPDLVGELAERHLGKDGTGRLAIIVPSALEAEVSSRLHIDKSQEHQIMVTTTGHTKGLEFDAVVLVEPGAIQDEAPSRLSAAADLYVAMTRPTQELVIAQTSKDQRLLDLG
ncbi:MAG: ATP-dependent DNA helicase, partial [Bifidobacterium sp.]|nr:ATP-dependent DNA helicase [Bifidobacterium sp.]